MLTTAYPSELGHAARKAHGANKPPRLMARLIEFFTRTGELVLDPFAGVGGTLLGAAIARGPRRAIGIELEPRWLAVYERGRARPRRRARRGGAASSPISARPTRAARAASIRPGCELRLGDALAILPDLPEASVDFIATDPPYNVQLPLTMAGGKLAETHANRRTDYAMVTESPADLANAPDYPTFLDRMGEAFGEMARVLRPGRYAAVIVRDAYQDGRYLFTAADLAARASAAGLVPKGDLIWYQAGTRLRPYGYPRAFVPNIAHQHIIVLRREPAPASVAAAARGEVGGQDVVVDVDSPIVQVSAAIGSVAVGASDDRPAPDDRPERHLVDPAAAAVRAGHEPVGALASRGARPRRPRRGRRSRGRAARRGRRAGGRPCSG